MGLRAISDRGLSYQATWRCEDEQRISSSRPPVQNHEPAPASGVLKLGSILVLIGHKLWGIGDGGGEIETCSTCLRQGHHANFLDGTLDLELACNAPDILKHMYENSLHRTA